MKDCYNWFIKHYGGDTQCKDESRLFSGSINASRKEITNRILPTRFIEKIVTEANNERKRLEKERIANEILRKDKHKAEIDLAAIKTKLKSGNVYLGDHSNYGKLAASMNAAGFNVNDFIEITPFVTKSKK